MDPVLVVDDDHDWTDALDAYFEILGIPVVVTHDGREALQQLRAGLRPSVIVLDLEMPAMSGVSFRFGQLAEDNGSSIPLVVCSGVREGAATAQLLGAAAFLPKPVPPRQLVDKVRELSRSAAAS
jgi:CheY-like chemotaxis protein